MSTRNNIFWIVLLAAIWLSMSFLVDPVGEFPLNDDWSYSLSVKALVERNELEFTGWVSMPLIVQVIWGAIFSLIDGFSFTALRLSTIVLGFWSVAATFIMLRSTGAGIAPSILGATILLTNPVFFSLSHTFMTDVPFTAMFVTSAALLLSGIRRDSIALIAAGLIFATLAMFVRQLGLALFAGFAIGYLSRNGLSPKRAALALAPAAVGLALYIGYGALLEHLDKTPALYSVKTSALLGTLTSMSGLKTVAANGFKILVYLGLFLLPFVLLRSEASGGAIWKTALAVAGGLLVAGILIFNGYLFPVAGNVLFKTGCGAAQFSVGPVTLRDTFILCMNSAPTLPEWLQIALLVVGAVSGTIGTVSLLRLLRSPVQGSAEEFFATNWQNMMLLSLTLVYIAPLLVGGLFDRYLIPILPLLMAAGLHGGGKWAAVGPRLIPTMVSLVVLGVFSIIATHDYLSWNRARWSGLDFLKHELSVSSLEIDGGFEYNGLQNYSFPFVGKEGKSWWWVHDDLYVISFNLLDGYREIRSFPINSWLPGTKDRILVLRRIDR